MTNTQYKVGQIWRRTDRNIHEIIDIDWNRKFPIRLFDNQISEHWCKPGVLVELIRDVVSFKIRAMKIYDNEIKIGKIEEYPSSQVKTEKKPIGNWIFAEDFEDCYSSLYKLVRLTEGINLAHIMKVEIENKKEIYFQYDNFSTHTWEFQTHRQASDAYLKIKAILKGGE